MCKLNPVYLKPSPLITWRLAYALNLIDKWNSSNPTLNPTTPTPNPHHLSHSFSLPHTTLRHFENHFSLPLEVMAERLEEGGGGSSLHCSWCKQASLEQLKPNLVFSISFLFQECSNPWGNSSLWTQTPWLSLGGDNHGALHVFLHL